MKSIKLADYIYLIKCPSCKSYRFFEMRDKPPAKVACLNCGKRFTFWSKRNCFNQMVVIKRIDKHIYYENKNKGLLMEKAIGGLNGRKRT